VKQHVEHSAVWRAVQHVRGPDHRSIDQHLHLQVRRGLPGGGQESRRVSNRIAPIDSGVTLAEDHIRSGVLVHGTQVEATDTRPAAVVHATGDRERRTAAAIAGRYGWLRRISRRIDQSIDRRGRDSVDDAVRG